MAKKISHYEVVEYTYNSVEERSKHIQTMQRKGWEYSGVSTTIPNYVPQAVYTRLRREDDLTNVLPLNP